MELTNETAHSYKDYCHFQVQKGLRLIDLINPQPNEWIVDVGCGTGMLTYEFAKKVSNGQIIALDPDQHRIHVADQNTPPELKNVTWINQSIEEFNHDSRLFDAAYSNFVLHWVENKQAAFERIYHALKPGGRFAFQAVYERPPLIKEILELIGERGVALSNRFHLIAIEQWESVVEKAGFKIKAIQEGNDYHFSDLTECLKWWEATTNAAFKAEWIPKAELDKLYQKYHSAVNIYGKETLVMLAEKDV